MTRNEATLQQSLPSPREIPGHVSTNRAPYPGGLEIFDAEKQRAKCTTYDRVTNSGMVRSRVWELRSGANQEPR